jgi:hypothetical protein
LAAAFAIQLTVRWYVGVIGTAQNWAANDHLKERSHQQSLSGSGMSFQLVLQAVKQCYDYVTCK